jgi:hypothetical protein
MQFHCVAEAALKFMNEDSSSTASQAVKTTGMYYQAWLQCLCSSHLKITPIPT